MFDKDFCEKIYEYRSMADETFLQRSYTNDKNT